MKRPEGFDPASSRPEPPKTGRAGKATPSKDSPASTPSKRVAAAQSPTGAATPTRPATVAPIRPAVPAPPRDPKPQRESIQQRESRQQREPKQQRESKPQREPKPERRASAPVEPSELRSSTRSRARAERREARRFTRGSRRRRATLATLLGIVALLVAVLLVAVFSPILALRTIQVDGVSDIPASAVQGALAGQLGTPLALLNDGTIREKLSHIILIRSYTTEIVPPNTLVVRIVERQAIGVVPDGEEYDQVDPAGVVLRKSATPAGLPIIEIGRSSVSSAGFAAAVKVLLAMPSQVLTEVKSISATTLDNVSITLAGSNHTILWGSSAQSDLKAQVLADLLKRCASKPVLNVTAPLAAACGPIQKPPTAQPTPTGTSTPAG